MLDYTGKYYLYRGILQKAARKILTNPQLIDAAINGGKYKPEDFQDMMGDVEEEIMKDIFNCFQELMIKCLENIKKNENL